MATVAKTLLQNGRAKRGRRVTHPTFGTGTVRFDRLGYPSVLVKFAHGLEKVSRADLS